MNGEGLDQDICRDFLRNACTRGKNCKFKHPAPSDLKKYATDVGLPFCHDYQNRGCERPNCRYMHISREEEKQIKETGIIPQHLISETSKNILHATDVGVLPGETPLCKDFQKGTCNRGMMCKYRHVDVTQDYSAAVAAAAATGYAQYGTTAEQQYYDGTVAPPQKRQMYDADYYNRIGGTATASYYRPATTTDYYSSYYRLSGATAAAAPAAATTASAVTATTTTSLADENKALKDEVEKMKLQLAELRAANDLLLEQNARLRVTKEQVMPSTAATALASVAPVAEQTPATTQDPSAGSSSAADISSGTEVVGGYPPATDSSTAQTPAVDGGSSEIPNTGSQSTSDATTGSEQSSEAPGLASDTASSDISSGAVGFYVSSDGTSEPGGPALSSA